MYDLNEFIQDSYLKNEVEQNILFNCKHEWIDISTFVDKEVINKCYKCGLIQIGSKMKMNNLEYQMNDLIKYINQNNLGFGWKNHPYRNHKGVYISGEIFDYCIFTKNYKCCFDCKETIHNRWSIRKKDILQAINLKKIYETGIDAFFLILFKKEMDLRYININDFLKIKALRNYIEPGDCKKWDYKELVK